MASCCVPGCPSAWRNDQTASISFHEIPANMALRERWLKVISRKNWTPSDTSNYSRVCSLHFQQSDFKVGTKRRLLLPSAVPSVFTTYPKYMQSVVEKSRKTANSTGAKDKLQINKPSDLPHHETFDEQQQANTALNCSPLPVRDSTEFAMKTSVRYVSKGVQIDSLARIRNQELRRWKNKYYHVVQKNKKLQRKLNDSRAAWLHHEAEEGSEVEKYKVVLQYALQGLASAVLLQEQVNNFRKKRPRWSESTIRRCIQWRNYSRAGYSYALNSMLMKLPSRFTLSRFSNSGATLQGESSLVTECLRTNVSILKAVPENGVPETSLICVNEIDEIPTNETINTLTL